MRKKWSSNWKSSKQPRKQRKYVYNAPLHIRKKFLSAHLSKQLREKYSRRSLPIRKGDVVKIMRGIFKNKTGKIEEVNFKKLKVYVEGAQIIKKDGTKTFLPIHPSNILIIELNISDKERQKILQRTKVSK